WEPGVPGRARRAGVFDVPDGTIQSRLVGPFENRHLQSEPTDAQDSERRRGGVSLGGGPGADALWRPEMLIGMTDGVQRLRVLEAGYRSAPSQLADCHAAGPCGEAHTADGPRHNLGGAPARHPVTTMPKICRCHPLNVAEKSIPPGGGDRPKKPTLTL